MEKASHRGQEAWGPERGWQLSLGRFECHAGEASLDSNGKAGMFQKAPQGFSGPKTGHPSSLLRWSLPSLQSSVLG